mmetsp:Transcript_95798/g.266016  ORF Transcript_95798/g.266016 Transcript_95798/m.266016 type:complete len:233 (-) Transcript_95798:166-864(-)
MSQDDHVVWGNIEVSTSSSVISASKTPVLGHITRIAESDVSSSMQLSTSGAPSPANEPGNSVFHLQGDVEDKDAKDHISALLAGYRSDQGAGLPRASSSKTKSPTAEAVHALLVEAGLERYWSQGSRAHTHGGCRPCHYWHTASGCRSSADCNFCHLPHARRTDAKSKRDASRQLAAEISDEYVDKSLALLTSRSPVLQAALQQRIMDRIGGKSPTPMPKPAPSARTHILSL